MEYRVKVHKEDGSYWAEVEGLPGCFASGQDLDELKDAVIEAITLYLADDDKPDTQQVSAEAHVDEFRVLIPA